LVILNIIDYSILIRTPSHFKLLEKKLRKKIQKLKKFEKKSKKIEKFSKKLGFWAILPKRNNRYSMPKLPKYPNDTIDTDYPNSQAI
jgi:hypothetical protein